MEREVHYNIDESAYENDDGDEAYLGVDAMPALELPSNDEDEEEEDVDYTVEVDEDEEDDVFSEDEEAELSLNEEEGMVLNGEPVQYSNF
jgi:hypothetical protein